MSGLIQPFYPWNRLKDAMKKHNQELGNIISLNLIFLYYLLFVFIVSWKIYPTLWWADYNLLGAGQISSPVRVLEYLIVNWWISVLLFFVVFFITLLFTSLITKTKLQMLRTYFEYVRLDIKNQSKNEVIKTIFIDLLKIAGFSVLGFLILELITFAISSLFVTILPITYNITEVSLSYFFLAILVTHILFFPLLVFFYNRMSMKKMVSTSTTDFQKYLTEEGEVDMEKWRKETWGKKPYTFDWEGEDVFPITCFSCGSIISSNYTICPICDTDLIKEIDEIEAETKEKTGTEETDVEN